MKMMKKMVVPALMVAGLALAGCASAPSCAPAPNTLSEAEKAEGWKLLWDGRTSEGWAEGYEQGRASKGANLCGWNGS